MKKSAPVVPPKKIFLALVLFGLCLALFFTFRYGGQWVESDTNVLTRAILLMQSEGTLFTKNVFYPHGILFQALSVLLSNLSGIQVTQLQRLVYPSLSMILLVSAAWFFYGQASRRTSTAAMAVLLLCLQPEVLFVVLRGSHEKLGWTLMMLSLALLYHSLGQRGPRLALDIFLFYLLAFAHISTNVYFASTYLTAILLGLLLGVVIHHLRRRNNHSQSANPDRLLYIGLSVSILLFIFMVSLYPPAINNLRVAENIYKQLSNLFVNPETAAQPYDYIGFGWINTYVYLGVTLFTWLLIVTSMLTWFWRGWRLLRGKDAFTLRDSLDWLLYAGFALQVGIFIIVDFSGALSQNLQLRVFPGFTVMAALLLAKAVIMLNEQLRFKPALKRMSLVIGAVLFAWFAAAAALKPANEPLLSNMWTIYSRSEIQAVNWSVNHLENTDIWTGMDLRVRDAYSSEHLVVNHNVLHIFRNYEDIRHVLSAQKDVLRAERTGFPLPPVFGWLQVYDNGGVQLLKKPPVTPFQK